MTPSHLDEMSPFLFSSAPSAGTDVRFIPSELFCSDGIVQTSYCPVPPGRDGSNKHLLFLSRPTWTGWLKQAPSLSVPSHLDGMAQTSTFSLCPVPPGRDGSNKHLLFLSRPTWTGWFKQASFPNKHLLQTSIFSSVPSHLDRMVQTQSFSSLLNTSFGLASGLEPEHSMKGIKE